MPFLVRSMLRPMALVNSAPPSPSIITLSPAFWSLPQAPITNASLTEMQAMVSTPLALILSNDVTKPGTCLAEQVGVKAPGRAKATTFLPGANNSSVVTALGPSGPIPRSVAWGTLSPTLTISLAPLQSRLRTLGKAGFGVRCASLEVLQDVLGRRRLESARLLDEQVLDDPVLNDHGIALAAHAETVLGQVHRQAHRLAELARAIGQHQDLAVRLGILGPSAHHECVIHGDAGYRVDALALDRINVGQKTWHMLGASSWGECTRQGEGNHLLAGAEKFLRRYGFRPIRAHHPQCCTGDLLANLGHSPCPRSWQLDGRTLGQKVGFCLRALEHKALVPLIFDLTIPMDLGDTLNMPGSSTPAATLVGRFLVAAPSMPDERFQKSVVFICKHDDDGALGIIVNNKVEDLALGEVYKQLGIDGPKTANLQAVLFGGPVETARGLVLHSSEYKRDETLMIEGGMALTASLDILRDMAKGSGPQRA